MSTTLGKRKERDDEEPVHGSTLFVSNLPYQVTSVDLQTLFSDIAPVRSAFVVLEQGTGVSKGVGYVSFSLREDAQSAFEKISSEGIQLAGRALRVQFAENKPTDKEKSEKVKKQPKPPRPAFRQTPHDPVAIRTIVVAGLPSGIDSKVLWKKFRKCPGAEKIDWPVKLDDETEDPSTAHVLFTSPTSALDAVNKLHAHVFKGSLLSVTLKKRLDTLSKPQKKPIEGKPSTSKASSLPSHGNRLIVRNIPFNLTEQDLRALFLPYGPIHSIDIPSFEPKEGETRKLKKGFAFVWMLSKKDAEKAMEGCNGKVVRAGMAEGLLLDKQKKKKIRRLEKKEQLKLVKGQDDDAENEEEDEEETPGNQGLERTIAVDWALSKDKWKQEKAKIEAVEEDEDESSSGSSGSDTSDEDETSGSEQLGVHHSSDDDEDASDASESDDESTPVKPQLPDTDVGTTLFVRNVPFSSTEDELRTLFRAFGPLRYARITLDPASGRSRGTGFACFWNKEDADKVVEQSELLKLETTGLIDVPKKNPFTLPSILTPDPSSTLAKSLVLQGRTLDVVRAVTRDVAGKLKEDGERQREKADKRNMYLLREGVILPNSPAADTLTPAELERRSQSFNSRKVLLKSNPSLYISKTRLSIRQIPTFVTEHMLKRLAIHAVKTFESAVKSGTRQGLTSDELLEVVDEEEPEVEDKKGRGKWKAGARNTGVKQAKIVRQQERVDPVTGKGRSKGYGFLEMHKHSDALRVLRWANNNPEVNPLFDAWWKDELKNLVKLEKAKSKEEKDDARLKRMNEEIEQGAPKSNKGSLIVEFSIENVQVVQRRNTLQKDHAEPRESKKRSRESKTKGDEQPGKQRKTKAVSEQSEEPSPKKRRVTLGKPSKDKPGDAIGSLIGRKRRQKKGGK
ncbi:hypothetical protein C8J56DRAFT_864966 [Mycena floridula]|nr:hypothetical protein C8J56DRAFT_864966 [Mycena floridula]